VATYARSENRRGITAMLAATAVFVVNDTLIKIAAEALPTGEAIFLRGLLTTLFCALLLVNHGTRTWPSSTTLLTILGSSTALVAGQYWLITAMRTGEIAAVAPFRYSVTLWAVLAGYLVW